MLKKAKIYAQSGRFDEMLAICRQIIETNESDVETILNVGVLLLSFGYLTLAHQCFERVNILSPNDLRPLVNIANLMRDAGDHGSSLRLYQDILKLKPDHPVIHRNFLVSQEYDPTVDDSERFQHAIRWGEWAIAKAGGLCSRPSLSLATGRPLRIGYVSADLCQHTVGLYLKMVLKAHDTNKVTVFAYSAGRVDDWVTDAIRGSCSFRDISTLDDAALVELIHQDEIDVLIDLSGHTAESRLTVFAHRPAPVMVSWLGYFATTGLSYVDAVILDEWHAPSGTESQFVEPIVRLPFCRLCYQPVPWAPAAVSSLPCLQAGHITFGCFNNTAKLNDGVFDVWAKVLDAVPESRLVLKWRTLADESLSDAIRQAFAKRGIDSGRVELRPASFHAHVLMEYAEIDIALDPFPFTGGMTSCEALWMGVPIVTLPQSRVVSRQTFAFLSAIGLPELAATDALDYVRIAAKLAADIDSLSALRSGLRDRMFNSPLMDVKSFTRELENTLFQIYRRIQESQK